MMRLILLRKGLSKYPVFQSMMKKISAFLSYFLLALLPACAAPPALPSLPSSPSAAAAPETSPPHVEIVTVTVPSEIDELFSYYEALLRLPPAELQKELNRLDTRPWSARSALQRALILTLYPGNGDLARSQALLDSVLYSGDPQADELRPVAQLLVSNFAERKRLAEQLEKVNQQLREGQRRNTQLNQMLEGLKAIERSLPAHSGDKTTATPPAPK